jgi:hypothetical protein
VFAGDIRASREMYVLLAMQKVVGSNPISRFEKSLHLQAFFVSSVGLCVFVTGQ